MPMTYLWKIPKEETLPDYRVYTKKTHDNQQQVRGVFFSGCWHTEVNICLKCFCGKNGFGFVTSTDQTATKRLIQTRKVPCNPRVQVSTSFDLYWPIQHIAHTNNSVSSNLDFIETSYLSFSHSHLSNKPPKKYIYIYSKYINIYVYNIQYHIYSFYSKNETTNYSTIPTCYDQCFIVLVGLCHWINTGLILPNHLETAGNRGPWSDFLQDIQWFAFKMNLKILQYKQYTIDFTFNE